MDYIAYRSGFDAAESFLDTINNKCQTLSKFPSMRRNRDELMENVRSFPIDDYLIFYSPIASGIEVLRVVRGYRDSENLFSE